ncbi:SAM-dependent methyltransferase [Serratia quinivorans]|uniref:SAM-dependent methyltransferase n=1 Tax=Serratia quinivorans TaxID=137545 RepID=UPI001CB8CB10|nr:SAM-dependent methyltransferase [Serratia quinivorans]
MNSNANTDFSTYEFHQLAWEALAKDIAKLKPTIKKYSNTENTPNSKAGKLTIIGSGIETLGFSFGDEELIKSADKILYCVADPATVVWLRKLRPDALDLYVLYGEDKSRYTTYMQMTEAQLYWVRQGLNVVVIFYGHPGIFVLSTHRAIKLARREGHLAIMKAGVSALDTLCADLGVDPSHPGLQTHEATDCLIRRRNIDTSLHVILWQVGLIGELGFRRHGYLNNGFSYFVNWLIKIYGPDYQVTHYIGSRYPTIAPLINIHTLNELYDPDIQATITGISTFYIPPRDVIETDRQTAIELGLLKEGQNLVTPVSPLREIGLYGKREMAAFDAFSKFSIPKSYRWQSDTPASDFLIALRFDPSLQNIYLQQPQLALDDPRFSNLSDKERQLLASRDSGAIQIAAKGGYIRSYSNEEMICSLLTSKKKCLALCQEIKGKIPL